MSILNGKDLSVTDAANSLPSPIASIQELLQPAILHVITKTQVDGYTQEVASIYNTYISKQPYNPQQLRILKEGERQWRWFSLWIMNDCILHPDDMVTLHGVNYRVMQKESWQEYGYSKYDVIEDYTTT